MYNETLSYEEFITSYDFSNFHVKAKRMFEIMEMIKNKTPKKEILKQYTKNEYMDAKEQLKFEQRNN